MTFSEGNDVQTNRFIAPPELPWQGGQFERRIVVQSREQSGQSGALYKGGEVGPYTRKATC